VSEYKQIAPESQRFEELLPFYLTGQLQPEDEQFVTLYLKEHPADQDALQFSRKMKGVVKATGEGRDLEASLQRLLAACQPEPRTGFFERLRAWLGEMGLNPALAVALVVIVLQSTVGALYLYSNRVEHNGITVAELKAQKPHARLLIASDVDAEPLLNVLHRFEARIIDSVHPAAGSKTYEVMIIIEQKMHLDPLVKDLSSKGLILKAELL
jgi:hypothetical protein